MNNLVALEPKQFPAYLEAIEQSGGKVSTLTAEVKALVWTDYARPDLLAEIIRDNPQLEWVQLPFAGVDAFSHLLDAPLTFTSAKGAYREPVAEHALALALALGRKIPERVKATTWGKKFAVSLFDADILMIGAGGITECLIELLAPFRCRITVLRNRPNPVAGAIRVGGIDELDTELGKNTFVFINAALTDQTTHLFSAAQFEAMRPDAYLINIARGPIIETESLIAALNQGLIAGAAVDVTDPEPLPDGHPLWSAKNILITPHTADTMPIVTKLFAERLRHNVAAFLSDRNFIGKVDGNLGY